MKKQTNLFCNQNKKKNKNSNKCTILYYCGLEHIADRSTKSLHATEILLTPNASNLTISLTLKTKAVTKCDSIRLEKIVKKTEKNVS